MESILVGGSSGIIARYDLPASLVSATASTSKQLYAVKKHVSKTRVAHTLHPKQTFGPSLKWGTTAVDGIYSVGEDIVVSRSSFDDRFSCWTTVGSTQDEPNVVWEAEIEGGGEWEFVKFKVVTTSQGI